MRRFSVGAIAVLCALSWHATCCRSETTEAKPQAAGDAAAAVGEQPKPEVVLRKMADYLGGLPAFSCKMQSAMAYQARGMNSRIETKYTLRLDKPKRFALIIDEGEMGLTMVTDGKQMTQFFPALNRYVVKDAPSDLSELGNSPELAGITMGLGASMPVNSDEFYKQMMTGVTGSEYLGTDKIGDVACDHLRFSQAEFDWEIWIEQGDRPLPRKIVPDLSKRFAQAGEAARDIKVEMSIAFSDWDVAPKFSDADFAFVPPANAEKVESLFGREEREEEPHPLLGLAAPPFKTVDLQQHDINLADHLGKDVVILDFWATWCGPCVSAMPIINEVAEKFKDRGVVFYAVNLRDDVETITEFLKSKDLNVPVAVDLDGAIGDMYKAEAIPQTVLIGKDGKVQVVHVGFSDGLRDELTKQLEDLLAGKDLASEELAKAEKAKQARAERRLSVGNKGVASKWSMDGSWSGVATDQKAGEVVAIGNSGHGAGIAVNADGVKTRDVQVGGSELRLANLAGDGAAELLVFQPWGPSVKAYEADGRVLWTYEEGQGIDDVWAADLDGDGMEEVIIGYNGGTGLHVLDHQGTPLWKFTEIGNVWHVSAGDFSHDGKPDVVTTSAAGKLHAFDAAGKKLKDIPLSFYGDIVRLTPAENGPVRAIVAGTGENRHEVLASVDFDGQEAWKIELPSLQTPHVDEMALAAGRPWAAVAMRGGLVNVVDLDTHEVVAQVADQGMQPGVAWLPRAGESPLLVVATGKELVAYEITPTKVEAEAPAKAE